MSVPDSWPEPGHVDPHQLIVSTVLQDSHPDLAPDRLAVAAARKRLSELRTADGIAQRDERAGELTDGLDELADGSSGHMSNAVGLGGTSDKSDRNLHPS